MAYARLGAGAPVIETCRYPGSKLQFRAPMQPLAGRYVACLGGCATHGRVVAEPYPARLSQATGLTCVNLGLPNAGVDVMLGDTVLRQATQGAAALVVQLPGAANLSNRFYRVHPRRNDRFLAAAAPLRAFYPEMDFTAFHFTRHMLGVLQARGPDRFAEIVTTLRRAWLARMGRLIARADGPVILLWLSRRRAEVRAEHVDSAGDPVLITRTMLERLRPQAAALVELTLPAPAASARQHTLAPGTERLLEAGLPDAAAHERTARALAATLRHLTFPAGAA